MKNIVTETLLNIKRDKFLVQAMGECWHEISYGNPSSICFICGKHESYCMPNLNFSTWEGFGKLLEWCQKQNDILLAQNEMTFEYLTPDRFANAIYDYLLKKEENSND